MSIALGYVPFSCVIAWSTGRPSGDSTRGRGRRRDVGIHRPHRVRFRLDHPLPTHGVDISDHYPTGEDPALWLAASQATRGPALQGIGCASVRQAARRHRMEQTHRERTRLRRHARGPERLRSTHPPLRNQSHHLSADHHHPVLSRSGDGIMGRRHMAHRTWDSAAPLPSTAPAAHTSPHPSCWRSIKRTLAVLQPKDPPATHRHIELRAL